MNTIDYAIRVATQMQSEGKLEQARSILKCILNVNPNHAFALHLLGIITYQTGFAAAGIQLIEQAITHNPLVALFHSNLGEIHRQLKAIDLSIACGQRAIALDANAATAFANLGIAYYDAKQYIEAEECHKRALSLNPKLKFSLNNMGSIYKMRGNIKQAIAFYQACESFNNLGVLFLEQQEFKQALDYFNRAITSTPQLGDPYCNKGFSLAGLNRFDEAINCFKKTLQLNPNSAEAYYGIAKIQLHKHDYVESENMLWKAIHIKSEQAEFYQLLAEIYHAKGNHNQALIYLDQALSINSTLASLYISKGSMLMEIGELSRAEEQFLKNTNDSQIDIQILAHYSLVQLRKINSDNLSLKALLSIANHVDSVSTEKLPYLYFALGKCYDDMGEWSTAFAYFTKGCNLKRKNITFDIQEQIHLTHKLIHVFTKETIDYLKTFSNPSALPIFIVGMPRSGTTLVEQILASHSLVYGAGELPYLNDLTAGYPDNITQLSAADYRMITDNYLLYLQRLSSDAVHITDKMPHNFIAIGLIHALFPNAKIIHVKRNALDTCLSCYTKLFNQGQFYSYDLIELGQYYSHYEMIMNHWRQILPADAFLEINYEDVVTNLEAEAKRLIAYCNLTWDPACAAFYQSKRKVSTASFMQVRQPVYTSSVKRWQRFKDELSPLINAIND